MKKNEALRFELLKELLYAQNGVTTKEMMKKFTISSKTFYRYKQKLNDDLNTVFLQRQVKIRKSKLFYKIELADSLTFSYVIDSMRLYYIKNSQIFSILAALLRRHYVSVESLAQDLSLSPSHVYSNLKRVKNLLSPFHLKISFAPTLYQTNIIGEEKNIRVLGFILFWIIFKGLEWPFEKTPLTYQTLPIAVEDERLSFSQKNRIRYFQNVTFWRILYRKEHLSLREEFMDYLRFFEQESPTFLFSKLDHIDFESIDVKSESYFFGFLSRFLVANIDSDEEKKNIAEHFINSELPIALLTSKILNKLLLAYNVKLTSDNYLKNYYLLIINLLYIRYVGVDFRRFLVNDSVESKAKWFSPNEDSYRSFVKESLVTEPLLKKYMKPGFISLMAKFFHSILKSAEKEAKLLIFIQHSPNNFIYDFVKNNLLIIFGDSTLDFTFDANEADIIISDSFELEQSNDRSFHFEHSHDPESWKALILFISGKIYALHNPKLEQ
ncbi:hypothetical protein UAY_03043 [Enterococcus moraviensis ATCC BAA-383]|uniref:Mga helix-turn-helix domain-containing protein n=1 Tax=Enterococcus moraviensis ATCC BAA-383 TaxID=1158609 RepID=R2QLP0_9ENTE|nr:helix-turn-helix domain-containing protein [Enterococcus moraviensis]EOH96133.1 hypothetical protein UAY_03043 [Enterococcus moraviensis ATCC BAA-383]EOT66105.1 hypothetical protein I586_02376 [Enterococcus moraviensis ATCC BAA-383]